MDRSESHLGVGLTLVSVYATDIFPKQRMLNPGDTFQQPTVYQSYARYQGPACKGRLLSMRFHNNTLSSFRSFCLSGLLFSKFLFLVVSQSSVLGLLTSSLPLSNLILFCRFSYHLSIFSGHLYFLYLLLRHVLSTS